MYLDYWQLTTKPFTSVSWSLYASPQQAAALAKLQYVLSEPGASALLAGPSGIGKTTLVHRLVEALQSGEKPTPALHVVFPQMSDRDLLAYLAERLGAPAIEGNASSSLEVSIRRLEDLAALNVDAGICPLLIIDEAHLLEDAGVLETLRLLMNFRTSVGGAFRFLFVGQPGLLSSIGRWPTLEERLGVKVLLRPFTEEESAGYILHQLAEAGADRPLLTEAALRRVHQLSGGIARRINRLIDLALVVGMAEQLPAIDAAQVDSVERELITLGAAA